MARQTITSGSAPVIWSTIDDAFDKINSNFAELYASIGETDSVGFDALNSDLIPAEHDTYDLGFPTRRWKTLYVSDSVSIGGVSITNEGSSLDLPSGSTVAGQLIIDPNKSFFKEFTVNNTTSIIANAFNDVLNFQEGLGIALSTNSSSDSIVISNDGVREITAGTAMTVSSATGNVTVNNNGVTSAVAGLGISVSAGIGAVTFSNAGIVDIDAGVGITVGARDPVTGKVIITNSQPAVNSYRSIAVSGEATLTARSPGDTLTFIEGNGINITTLPAAGALTNRVTVENSGVLSLVAGNNIVLSGGTGNVTVSFNNRVDIIGSVYADDSTRLIDGTDAQIVGNINTASLRTSETQIRLGASAGLTNQGAVSVAIGSDAGVTNQGQRSVAIGNQTGQINQGRWSVAIGPSAAASGQGDSAVAIGDNAGQSSQGNYAIAIGYYAGHVNQSANSIILNASGSSLNGAAAAFYVNPVRSGTSTGNILNYNTSTKEIFYSSTYDGDITGSVFGDDSTKLVDGVESKIVGPVETNYVTASSYIQTAVYADLTAIAAAFPIPNKGMIVFDDGTNQFRGFDGSSWVALN